MTEEERRTQEALGLEEEYEVTVNVPIKTMANITIQVMAVSVEDAITQAKLVHKITPPDELLKEVMATVRNNYRIVNSEFDTERERKYTAHNTTASKSATASNTGSR